MTSKLATKKTVWRRDCSCPGLPKPHGMGVAGCTYEGATLSMPIPGDNLRARRPLDLCPKHEPRQGYALEINLVRWERLNEDKPPTRETLREIHFGGYRAANHNQAHNRFDQLMAALLEFNLDWPGPLKQAQRIAVLRKALDSIWERTGHCAVTAQELTNIRAEARLALDASDIHIKTRRR